MHRFAPLLAIAGALVLAPAHAQRTVYLCDGTYTDQPCASGREVDVTPNQGANSLSGQRRESPEVQMDNLHRAAADGQRKGVELYRTITRCIELRDRRAYLDGTGQAETLKAERFAIRQEQFRLNCKYN